MKIKNWLTNIISFENIRAAIPAYVRYFKEMREYAGMPFAEPFFFRDAYPCLFDRQATTSFDAHYFYQDIWAFKSIKISGVTCHVDIGSLAIFVGMLTTISTVISADIRPMVSDFSNLWSLSTHICELPFSDDSLLSISCLHVAEHVGLGRYGDPLDPEGTKKATRELARILAPGGNLYFSVPVGRPRVCFNAHRIHSPGRILEYFYDLKLVEFSGVSDNGGFIENVDPEELSDSNYACGLFHFTKPQRLIGL